MVELLLQIMYFIRPIGFIHVPFNIFGLNLFEWLTILTTLLMFVAALARSHLLVGRRLDSLDRVMLLFVGWCLIISAIQHEVVDFRLLMKWILPFVLYLLLRRVVFNAQEYFKCLRVMIAGFLIVVLFNSVAVLQGRGLWTTDYWTGLSRYSGIYQGVHEFGHNMAFVLMLVPAYFLLLAAVGGSTAWRRKKWVVVAGALLLPLSVYGIFKSGVRTAIIGIGLYYTLLLFFYSKKLFVSYLAGVALVIVLAMPFFSLLFSDLPGFSDPSESRGSVASGRPEIWKHNLAIFSRLDFGEKMIGVGPGNILTATNSFGGIATLATDRVLDSHNDYLKTLMETGVIGLLLILAFYLILVRRAFALPRLAKAVFVAMLAAVVVMNISSNSYLARFGLGQMFAMVMLGLDIVAASTRTAARKAGAEKKSTGAATSDDAEEPATGVRMERA